MPLLREKERYEAEFKYEKVDQGFVIFKIIIPFFREFFLGDVFAYSESKRVTPISNKQFTKEFLIIVNIASFNSESRLFRLFLYQRQISLGRISHLDIRRKWSHFGIRFRIRSYYRIRFTVEIPKFSSALVIEFLDVQ